MYLKLYMLCKRLLLSCASSSISLYFPVPATVQNDVSGLFCMIFKLLSKDKGQHLSCDSKHVMKKYHWIQRSKLKSSTNSRTGSALLLWVTWTMSSESWSAYYSKTMMGIIPLCTKVVKQWLVSREKWIMTYSHAHHMTHGVQMSNLKSYNSRSCTVVQ